MVSQKEIKDTKAITILTLIAELIVITMMIFTAILMITKSPLLPTKSIGDMIAFWVMLIVSFSVFTWAFISQVKEYFGLLYDVQKEKIFDEFTSRLTDMIEVKKLEISVKETEEKLENIGVEM